MNETYENKNDRKKGDKTKKPLDKIIAAKTYPKLRPPTHFGDGGVFSCDEITIRALFCTTFSQLYVLSTVKLRFSEL